MPHVTGWLVISFDPQTNVLDVQATESETGEVFEFAYELNTSGNTPPDEVVPRLLVFFEYMNAPTALEARQLLVGLLPAGTIAGPSSCACATETCSCSKSCVGGNASCVCGGDTCVCKCILRVV